MIDGNESIQPTTDSRYINNSDVNATVGVWGGITLKQHMVIEFTKALLSNKNLTNYEVFGLDHFEAVVGDSIKIANSVIKQLNEE